MYGYRKDLTLIKYAYRSGLCIFLIFFLCFVIFGNVRAQKSYVDIHTIRAVTFCRFLYARQHDTRGRLRHCDFKHVNKHA